MSQLMEHVNGTRQQGRNSPPLPEHTFKDSGITIKIRKIGPTTYQRLAQAIMRDMPDPDPPLNDPNSEAAELGEKYNRADADWLEACAAREQERRVELSNRVMRLAALEAEFEIDDAARVNIVRKKRHLALVGIPYEDDPKLTTEENEKVFYILQIAAATTEDWGECFQAVMRRSVPTEEAVQAQIATFQRDLPE